MLLNLEVKVSKKEHDALFERMSNWDALHASFEEDPPTVELVEKMLAVEVGTRKRMTLTTRLLGIYNNLARQENERLVLKALAED